MKDLSELPLFALRTAPETAPASCPPLAPPQSRAGGDLVAVAPVNLTPIGSVPTASPFTAEIVPFPACRNTRLVATLACEFLDLRAQHGRRSRSLLLERRFKPIRARLRRLKVSTDLIREEMACLEAAVARAVWLHDGGSSSGSGGSAA